jgi:hypothetical protein
MKHLLVLTERAELLLCVVAMNKHMAVHHGEPFSCVIYSRVPGFRGTRVRWMKQMNQVVRYKKIGTVESARAAREGVGCISSWAYGFVVRRDAESDFYSKRSQAKMKEQC